MSNATHDRPRVVVTGMGAVTNLGLDAPSTIAAMVEGKSGIHPIDGDAFAPWNDQWTVNIGGQVRGWDPTDYVDAREVRRIDRFALLGIAASDEAVTHSGIDFSREDMTRCGTVVGTGVGGIGTIEDGVGVLINRGPKRLSPFTVPRLMPNSCAGHVSIRHGLKGPSGAHATACASSGHAIADAVHLMQRGEADVVLAGGAEAAFTPICLGAFMTMRALSTRNDAPEQASRPFDRDRDGFVLAEGAAILVLETEEHAKTRGAEIYCEIAGSGASSDAGHITAPDAEGMGALRSMQAALNSAGIDKTDIDYINAHGTSTALGDTAEVKAVLSLFGDHARKSAGGRLMMSSTKSMHGHGLGASASIEMLACINALRTGIVPPTINCDSPDDGFDLDFVPHESRKADVRVVMNNTFGFGGHNVTLLARRFDG